VRFLVAYSRDELHVAWMSGSRSFHPWPGVGIAGYPMSRRLVDMTSDLRSGRVAGRTRILAVCLSHMWLFAAAAAANRDLLSLSAKTHIL
jgi:hypothetical protein